MPTSANFYIESMTHRPVLPT